MKNRVFIVLTCLMASLGLVVSITSKPGLAAVRPGGAMLGDKAGGWAYNRSPSTSPRIFEHAVPSAILSQIARDQGIEGGVTVAHDGSVWFNALYGIARLAYGKFYAFPADTPDPTTPNFVGLPIVTGPDDAVYTEAIMPQLGPTYYPEVTRTTASTRMQSFTYDGYGPDITGLTVGPDKRIYASVSSNNHFGVPLTSSLYAFKNFAYHFSYDSVDLNGNDANGNPVEPTAVTTGEDGSIWVAASTGAYNLLFRVSTQLKVTAKFRLPDNSQPAGLAWGPDDALWFTEPRTNRIGRTDGRGRTTEFKIPTANSFPSSITVGADSALWFSESNANKIARITTAGVVAEYTIPTANSNPVGVAAPSESLNDRVIWFAESHANKIGELRF